MTEGLKDHLTIRGIDAALWRRIRTEAVRREQPAGELVNQIFTEWLAQQPSPSGVR